MPLLADRVQETTSTQGTGAVTLLGAVEGYRTFNSVFANGNVVFYTIDDTFGNWEVGYGAVSTGVLSRTTVLDSSNSNNLVNFPAGTKRVFCVAPKPALLPDQTGSSGKFLTTDGSNPSWATVASGGVNSVAIATNYGFKGTSTGSSSVTLSLQTNVTGILKGNASTGTVTAAAAGTDYAAPTAGTVSQLLANDGAGGFSNVTVSTGLSYNSTTKALTNASTATVSSVTFTGDGTVLSSTPSTAVTTSGTLTAALKTQTANTVLAGPVGGGAVSPTFRSLVAADIPSLPYAGTTTGQTILAGNNIGGFQNVTLSGLSYNTGTSTLSVTGGSSTVINVADYGASPSASASTNTAAIQAAINAATSYGTTIVFPSKGSSGYYNINGTLTINQRNVIIDLQNCILQQTVDAPIFVVTSIYVVIRNGFVICSVSNASACVGVTVNNGADNFLIDNVALVYLFQGLVLKGKFQNVRNCYIVSCTPASGTGIIVNGLPDQIVIISDTIINADGSGAPTYPYRPYSGISIIGGGAVQIDNSEIMQCQYGMVVVAATFSEGIESIKCSNTYFDTCTAAAVDYRPGVGPIWNMTFSSCWYGNSAVGFRTTTGTRAEAVLFTGCEFANNVSAVVFQDNCNLKGIVFSGCSMNAPTPNTGSYGFYFGANNSNVTITGCSTSVAGPLSTPSQPVYFSSGVSNIVLVGNRFTSGSGGNPYYGSAPSNSVIANNLVAA